MKILPLFTLLPATILLSSSAFAMDMCKNSHNAVDNACHSVTITTEGAKQISCSVQIALLTPNKKIGPYLNVPTSVSYTNDTQYQTSLYLASKMAGSMAIKNGSYRYLKTTYTCGTNKPVVDLVQLKKHTFLSGSGKDIMYGATKPDHNQVILG